jgi:hypothetical protein
LSWQRLGGDSNRLAKEFEAAVRDLNESQDAEQRKEFLRRMSVILNQVDELILKQYPRQDSERNALSYPPDLARAQE